MNWYCININWYCLWIANSRKSCHTLNLYFSTFSLFFSFNPLSIIFTFIFTHFYFMPSYYLILTITRNINLRWCLCSWGNLDLSDGHKRGLTVIEQDMCLNRWGHIHWAIMRGMTCESGGVGERDTDWSLKDACIYLLPFVRSTCISGIISLLLHLPQHRYPLEHVMFSA